MNKGLRGAAWALAWLVIAACVVWLAWAIGTSVEMSGRTQASSWRSGPGRAVARTGPIDPDAIEEGPGRRNPDYKPPPKAKPQKVTEMSSWLVSGAGNSAANGTFVESGTYGGKPAYTNGAWWLWWSGSNWRITAAKGTDHDYDSGGAGDDLPDSPWNATTGTPPAPTVAEADACAVSFASDRADKRVNLDTTLKVKCEWSPAASRTLKIYVGATKVYEGSQASGSYTWTSSVGQFAAGTYNIYFETWDGATLKGTSNVAVCRIVAPVYGLEGGAINEGTPIVVSNTGAVGAIWSGGTIRDSDRGDGTCLLLSVAGIGPIQADGSFPTDVAGDETWETESESGDESNYVTGLAPEWSVPSYALWSALDWADTETEGLQEARADVELQMVALGDIYGGHSLGDVVASLVLATTFQRYYGVPGDGGPWPPPSDLLAINIVAPADGAQVAGTINIDAVVSGGTSPFSVEGTIGSTALEALVAPNFGAQWRWSFDTTDLDDGSNVVTLIVTDAAGKTATASATVIVANVAPETDEDPTVEILAPIDGSEQFGQVTVRARATDDVALREIRFYVDGALIATEAATGLQDTKEASFDSSEWANGDRNVTVWAVDSKGNIGAASVVVSIVNGTSDAIKVWFSDEDIVRNAEKWPGLVSRQALLGMIEPNFEAATGNPLVDFNYLVGFTTNPAKASSVAIADYTLVTPGRAHGIPDGATWIRWGLWALPQLSIGHWDLDGDATVAFLSNGADLYAVVWPAKVYKASLATSGAVKGWTLAASGPVLAEGETFKAAAWQGGKVLVATSTRLLAMDPDSGDVGLEIGMPTLIEALAQTATVAKAWGGDVLYDYEYAAPKALGAAAYDVMAMSMETSVVMGTADGKLIVGAPGAWVETALDGGGEIKWVGKLGGDGYAAGDNGLWHYTGGAWVREIVGTPALLALGEAIGYAWAGGEGATLWRRGAQNWSEYATVAGMVRAWALAEKGGSLLIAGTDDTAGARVWALTASAGDDMGSGWTPCVMAGILKSGAVI